MSTKSKPRPKKTIDVQKCPKVIKVVTNHPMRGGITIADFAAMLLGSLNANKIDPLSPLVIADGCDSIRPVRTLSIGRAQRIGKKTFRFNAILRRGAGDVLLLS